MLGKAHEYCAFVYKSERKAAKDAKSRKENFDSAWRFLWALGVFALNSFALR
jgi:hypothetical protein